MHTYVSTEDKALISRERLDVYVFIYKKANMTVNTLK